MVYLTAFESEKRFTNKISAYIGQETYLTSGKKVLSLEPGSGSNAATNEFWQAGFSPNFDTAYVYGPTRGRRYIIGLSWKL